MTPRPSSRRRNRARSSSHLRTNRRGKHRAVAHGAVRTCADGRAVVAVAGLLLFWWLCCWSAGRQKLRSTYWPRPGVPVQLSLGAPVSLSTRTCQRAPCGTTCTYGDSATTCGASSPELPQLPSAPVGGATGEWPKLGGGGLAQATPNIPTTPALPSRRLSRAV